MSNSAHKINCLTRTQRAEFNVTKLIITSLFLEEPLTENFCTKSTQMVYTDL